MDELREKAAYMRGVLEGVNFNGDEQRKRLWESLIDFCDEVADNIGGLEDSQREFADYIEAIDEDLCTLEKYFYNEGDDSNENQEVSFNSAPDRSVLEMSCPFCNQGVYFENEAGDYEVICPECGKVIWNSSTNGATEQPSQDIKADVL